MLLKIWLRLCEMSSYVKLEMVKLLAVQVSISVSIFHVSFNLLLQLDSPHLVEAIVSLSNSILHDAIPHQVPI